MRRQAKWFGCTAATIAISAAACVSAPAAPEVSLLDRGATIAGHVFTGWRSVESLSPAEKLEFDYYIQHRIATQYDEQGRTPITIVETLSGCDAFIVERKMILGAPIDVYDHALVESDSRTRYREGDTGYVNLSSYGRTMIDIEGREAPAQVLERDMLGSRAQDSLRRRCGTQ